jgi:hypothetical protein
MRTFWLILAIILITFGTYYAISYITLPPSPNRVGDESMSLSKVTQVATNVQIANTWTKTPGSSMIFYIFPTIKDRTSVSGNEYATALQIGNKLQFNILISPDAGMGSLMAPAQLAVSVGGKIETIDITSIPLQRWSCVVISKQGRIFNIYVNGNLKVSYTCTAMPDSDPTQSMKVGDLRLGGKIALISLAPYAMRSRDVRILVKDTTDTNGKPYLSDDSSLPVIPVPDLSMFNFNFLSIFMCPGGNCSAPKRPGPMEQWQILYA